MQTQDQKLSLYKLFSRTLDKHVQGDKKKNETETLKPWITKGIKQSIKIRDRLYKDITYSQAKSKKSHTTRNFMKKTREIPNLYGKGFIISYILNRAIELTLPLLRK